MMYRTPLIITIHLLNPTATISLMMSQLSTQMPPHDRYLPDHDRSRPDPVARTPQERSLSRLLPHKETPPPARPSSSLARTPPAVTSATVAAALPIVRTPPPETLNPDRDLDRGELARLRRGCNWSEAIRLLDSVLARSPSSIHEVWYATAPPSLPPRFLIYYKNTGQRNQANMNQLMQELPVEINNQGYVQIYARCSFM